MHVIFSHGPRHEPRDMRGPLARNHRAPAQIDAELAQIAANAGAKPQTD